MHKRIKLCCSSYYLYLPNSFPIPKYGGVFLLWFHDSRNNTFRKYNTDTGVTSRLKCSDGKQLTKSGRAERNDDDVIHTFYQTAQSLATVTTKQKHSLGALVKANYTKQIIWQL
jgi:hypothetical protein